MRQAIMTKPGVIEHREVSEPAAGPGQVLLRVKRIGVCGTDLHVYHGKHPFTPYPVVQGHEFSAVIEAVGPGVANLRPGMKATATPQEVCGKCRSCRRGDYHICDHLKVRGFQAPGVAQDLYVTEADKIVPLPDTFTFEQGALIEPTAVAVRSTSRAGDMQDRNVVVLGAGPIGNLVAQVCRCRGAKVLITDLSDFRLGKARDCGVPFQSCARTESLARAVERCFGEEGFDLAFECVGVEATMSAAVDAIQKGGKIVVLGVFGEKPRIDMAVVGEHELSIIGTLMYQHRDYVQAVDLVSRGKVITDPLVTAHFSFEEYLQAYQFIDKQGDKTLKVMIDL
jgi:2-desacetyl-2-hydroxyethyl bacteriochlorophyllide A dehydrogenase